jgi:hypothetical protein
MTHLYTLSDGVTDYMGSDEPLWRRVSVIRETPDFVVGIR